MAGTEDKDILQLFADENTRNQALSFLIEKYQKRLYWHIRKIVLSHDDTDDVLQNTFIKIKDEHNSSKLIFNVNSTLKLLTGMHGSPLVPVQSGIKQFYAKNTDGPPITSSSELNIHYGVFRI